MKISLEEVDNSSEKLIVTGMITSSKYLRIVSTIYRPSLMEIPYAKTVANWCLEYFEKYKRAPKRHIQDIYESHVSKNMDPVLSKLIGKFLSSISSEYESQDKLNTGYLLDIAEKRFKTKSLTKLCKDIKVLVKKGRIVEAEALFNNYKQVSLPSSTGINPLTDTEAVRNAFEDEEETLFHLPGALGDLINDQLYREGFIGIMAGEKKGKTWLLCELAYMAWKYRNNVAFFGVGDMSEKQMIKRFHIRMTGRSTNKKYCGDLLIPVMDCVKNQLNICKFKKRTCRCGIPPMTGDGEESLLDLYHKTSRKYSACSKCYKSRKTGKEFDPSYWYIHRPPVEPLTWRQGLRMAKKLENAIKARKFKLATYPTDTVNVKMMDAQLDVWERFEGFIPDVIVVDYPDIMAPEDSKKEARHQQNDTWKGLRRMSLKRRSLVIAVTQADSGAYEQHTLKLKNFSEDKRKYAHVTLMLAYNQSDEEKKAGVARIGVLVQREGEYALSKQITILQCLQIGRPVLASYQGGNYVHNTKDI